MYYRRTKKCKRVISGLIFKKNANQHMKINLSKKQQWHNKLIILSLSKYKKNYKKKSGST